VLKRRFFTVPVVVAVLTIVPAESQASAIGYRYWGGFAVNVSAGGGGVSASTPVRVPGGQLTHEISGNGLYVTWDAADYMSVGNLCEPSIRFTYGYGKVHIDGGVHPGCSHAGVWKYWMKRRMPQGTACAQLWIEGWRRMVTQQCHFVSTGGWHWHW
jgi:hypothetical protein